MSGLRRLTEGVLAGLLVSVLLPGPATAATVGIGALDIDVSPGGAPQPYSGTIVFDDRVFDLFGVPVNLGQDATVVGVTGGVVLQGFGGTFTADAESADPGDVSGSAAGDFICPESAVCLSGPVSFVGTFSSVGGTLPASWPPGSTYVFDGTVTYTGGSYHYSGRLAVNAFQPAATAASSAGCSGATCEVTVDPPPTTIVNSATGADVVVDARIVFPRVTTAGDTTVTAVSNVAGQPQANFAFNDDATFLDITTTADVDTGQDLIQLCVDYAIAGTVADPLALRLMHLEGGVWVDVTSSLDPATQTICGRVASLSPFGVALQTGCAVDGDCDDSNPCSSDTCDTGTCVHAATNAGAVCRPAVDGCDLEETCDGSSTTCPPDSNPGCATTTTTSTTTSSTTFTTSTTEPGLSTTTSTTTSSTATSPPSSSTSSSQPSSSTTTTSTPTSTSTTTTTLTPPAQVTRLTNTSADGVTCGSHSPDGQKIAHVRFGGGVKQLWVMNADGTGQVQLLNDINIDTPPCPRWSPNGSKLLFTVDDPDQEVYVVNADGTGLTNLTDNPAADGQARWSPDGTKIFFLSLRDPGPNPAYPDDEHYVMNADGTGVIRLSNDPLCNDVLFSLSPDGQKVVFERFCRSSPEDDGIYVMNADGSGMTPLVLGRTNDPLWSPDGSRIAFWIYDSPPDNSVHLFVMNADGTGQTDVSHGPVAGVDGFAWSPDGGKLFVDENVGGNLEIFVVNADGSGLTNLTSHPATDFAYSWSADGTRLVFYSDRDNAEGDLYSLELLSSSESVSADLPPGGTVSTGDTPSPADPVESSVTTPVGGTVTITEEATSATPPSGYGFLGQQVVITAPAATVENPLVLVFRIDASLLPPGIDHSTLQIFRNGSLVDECSGPAGTAAPDPCVSARQALADGAQITVLTSQASLWNFGFQISVIDVASATLHAASNAAGNNGSIRVAGTFAISPTERFGATAGIAVRVRDELGHDETHQFAATDCATHPTSGRIQCRSADRSAKAKFAPSRKAPGRFAFSIQLKRLALAAPFQGPVELTVTSDGGLERAGSIAGCAGVRLGLKCKTP